METDERGYLRIPVQPGNSMTAEADGTIFHLVRELAMSAGFALILHILPVVNSLWVAMALSIFNVGLLSFLMMREDGPPGPQFSANFFQELLRRLYITIDAWVLESLKTKGYMFLVRITMLTVCTYIMLLVMSAVIGQPLTKWRMNHEQVKAMFRNWKIQYDSSPNTAAAVTICLLYLAHVVVVCSVLYLTLALTFAIAAVVKAFRILKFDFHDLRARKDQCNYNSLPVNGEGEFRLVRLDKWRPFSCIKLQLCCSIVGDSHSYEAISYTWGNSIKTRRILVNGQTMLIPKGSYDALRGLASFRTHRWIWIDYVCINQSDDTEKSHQIKLMKGIYENADRVIVWLPTPGWIAFGALSLLQEILGLAEDHQLSGEQIFHKYEMERFGARWNCLDQFLRHAWFSRVWVVQEVGVARAVHMLCGWFYLDFEQLHKLDGLNIDSMVTALFRLAPDGRRAHKSFHHLHFMGKVSTILKEDPILKLARNLFRPLEQLRQSKLADPLRLGNILHSCVDFLATDPRDKVFALLGIATDLPILDPTIMPDYNKSTKQVYTDLAQYLLKSEDPFCAISVTGIGHPSSVQGLPSWAADWSKVSQCCPLDIPSYEEIRYKASRASKPLISFVERAQGLVCSIGSVRVTCIKAMGNIVPRIDYDTEEPSISSSGSYVYTKDFIESYRWHKESIDLAIRYAKPPYHTAIGEDYAESTNPPFEYRNEDPQLVESFWRTLVGNKSPAGSPAPATLGIDYRQWVAVCTMVYAENGKTSTGYSNIGQKLAGKWDKPMGFPTDNAFYDQMHDLATWGSATGTVTVGRRFCVTEDGRMGFVPPETKVGDEVYIFSGARVPVVVRRVPRLGHNEHRDRQEEKFAELQELSEDQNGLLNNEETTTTRPPEPQLWKIVGECYIAGIMEGEAFQDDNIEIEHLDLV